MLGIASVASTLDRGLACRSYVSSEASSHPALLSGRRRYPAGTRHRDISRWTRKQRTEL